MVIDLDIRNLIRSALEGNVRAFEEIVKKYDRRVLVLAYQLVGNTEDAKDVYQEVFMRVYDKLHQYRFESDFYTWLYRIVVNCAISYRKQRRKHQYKSIEASCKSNHEWYWASKDSEQDPGRFMMQKEVREQIEQSLDFLPLMQRIVFVLRFFQDFKIKDIAEIMSCSEGTIKNHLFRSTQKMRQQLTFYIKS